MRWDPLFAVFILVCTLQQTHSFLVVSPRDVSSNQFQNVRQFMSNEDQGFLLGPTGDDPGKWEDGNDETDTNSLSKEGSKFAHEEDEADHALAIYQSWSKSLKRAQESLRKKEKSLSNELKKAESLEQTKWRANLLTSNLYLFKQGIKTATVNDWEDDGKEVELTLNDSYESASAEADALFQEIRKVKRGSAVVKELLEETSKGLETLDELQMDLDACFGDSVNENMFFVVQDKLIRTSRQTGFSAPSDDDGQRKQKKRVDVKGKKPALGTPGSNVRKLESPGGCLVLVGRNRRGNEYLTFSVARGDDIWMHSRGCPGAHVLIQQRRGSPPVTDACIQFAADIAIFYSDARSEQKFDVTSAAPKHLLKPRGAPLGAVKLREEAKIYTGYPDQVAEDLKWQREQSGQEESYRFADKGKHRKKTKEAAKEQQAKRKARSKAKRQ